MKQLNCWIDEDTAAEIEAEAKRQGRSTSNLLRQIISLYLEGLKAAA